MNNLLKHRSGSRPWQRQTALLTLYYGLLFTSPMCATAIGQSVAPGSPDRPWMNTSLAPQQRVDLLLKRMTLEEKLMLLHGAPRPTGAYIGHVPANERLGIPELNLADGRAGVGNHVGGVTLLPAPLAAASSWDVHLLRTYGEILGQEEWDKGTNVTLAPTIDVVRVPQWGRTFESYGEDPYFNARMAVAEISGIQSRGPIADANMYLTMNQENERMKEDSIVDERTLKEIYLPPFAAAISEAHVGSLMCAYVKTNGVYSCEDKYLLQTLLRDQLHFEGWVVSDWGATHSTVDSANNGLDQEMEHDDFFGSPLKAAIGSGTVSTATIDQHARHILFAMFQAGLFDHPNHGNWNANVRTPQHEALSREIAEQGTVLLKNAAGILPLAKTSSVAIIGVPGDSAPRVEGSGSSGVVAPYKSSPLEGIRERLSRDVGAYYADGTNLQRVVEIAKKADVAIVFAQTADGEGKDRPDLSLPDKQDELISTVAQANPHTIVVLNTGGVVLMPWIDHVGGVLEAWFPGQEDGNAIAAVLFGEVNPSAKLTLTIPRTASQVPTATPEQWPGTDGKSIYSEKLNVGYRWFDAHQVEPLFPFGFGLSYTTFRLDSLAVSPHSVGTGSARVAIDLRVTNIGAREGAEVVQVYVQHPSSNGEPPRQLRAFSKISLKPGETRPVHLTLDEQSFSIFDVKGKRWVTPPGQYDILVGSSSRDLPLHKVVTIGAAQ